MTGKGSSCSNLSPLAQPFTLDMVSLPKPRSNPFVDLAEPPYKPTLNPSFDNWVNIHQPVSWSNPFSTPNPEFDPLLSTEYRYLPPSSSNSHVPNGSFFYDQCSTGLHEVNPYYLSYVSASVGNVRSAVANHSGYDLLCTSDVVSSIGSGPDDYAHSLFGLEYTSPHWAGLRGDGVADWPQTSSNLSQVDTSFCPKDSCMNHEFYTSEGLTKYEKSSLGNSVEKQVESTSAGQLNNKSFLGDSKSISTPTLETELAIPRAHPQLTFLGDVNSRNPEAVFSYSREQCTSNLNRHASGSIFTVKSSSTVTIRPPMKDASTFGGMKSGSIEDRDFAGNNAPILKDSHSFMNSQEQHYFEANKLKFHLEEYAHDFAEISLIKDEDFPIRIGATRDVRDISPSGKPPICVSSSNQDDLSLNITDHKVLDSTEDHSKTADQLNPDVDSPCWRGAPVSRLNPFEVSEAAILWDIGKGEGCSSLSMQTQDSLNHMAKDAVKVSMQPINSLLHYEQCGEENNAASSSKRPVVAIVLPGRGFDDAVHYRVEQSSSCENHIPDAIDKLKKENAVSDNSMGDSDHRAHNTEVQSFEVSGISIAPIVAEADTVRNGNFNLNTSSSHVPFSSIDHEDCQPPAKDAPSKIIESKCEQLRPKMYIQILVNTIKNLSDLLLFDCSSDTCELNEEDCVILKDVTKNLDACVLKKVDRLASKGSLAPQVSPSPIAGSLDLQEGQLVSQLVQEGEHDTVSGKKDENLSEVVSARTAAYMAEEEHMTQAIKKILAENFYTEKETQPEILLYRNLWLEAEASLCSINYMARFNRMKNEIDTHGTEKATVKQSSCQVSFGTQISDTFAANTMSDLISRDFILESTPHC